MCMQKIQLLSTVDWEIFAVNFFASCLGGENEMLKNFLRMHLIFATWPRSEN